MDKIIEQMKQLGMTEYEVKTYLALLSNYPMNGYGLSKSSGVPRSRIYEVLAGLTKKQVVFEKENDKGVLYYPLEPALLLKKLRDDFDKVMASVDDYTNKLYNNDDSDMEPKVIRGREQILDLVKLLIGEAQHRVALSIWDEELLFIKDALDSALERGLLLRGIYFGHKNPFDDMVSHRRIERYLAESDERYIIAVIDDKHVIFGVISRGDLAEATWSKDPGIIDINDDFIGHDVMLNTYNTYLNGEELSKYEHRLDLVRKRYYGYSDEEFELFPMYEEKDKL